MTARAKNCPPRVHSAGAGGFDSAPASYSYPLPIAAVAAELCERADCTERRLISGAFDHPAAAMRAASDAGLTGDDFAAESHGVVFGLLAALGTGRAGSIPPTLRERVRLVWSCLRRYWPGVLIDLGGPDGIGDLIRPVTRPDELPILALGVAKLARQRRRFHRLWRAICGVVVEGAASRCHAQTGGGR